MNVNKGCLTPDEIDTLIGTGNIPLQEISDIQLGEYSAEMNSFLNTKCKMTDVQRSKMRELSLFYDSEKNRRSSVCNNLSDWEEFIKRAKSPITEISDEELRVLLDTIRSARSNNCNIPEEISPAVLNLNKVLELEQARRDKEREFQRFNDATRPDSMPMMTSDAVNRLGDLTEEANLELQIKAEKEKFENLTVKQVVNNISDSVLGLMADILIPEEDTTFAENLQRSLAKNNRMVWLGIVVVVIAVFIGLLK